MKNFLLACLLVTTVNVSFAQFYSTVNGTPSAGVSSGVCVNGTFTNVSNLNTSSTTDFVDFSLLAGVGCLYWLHSTLSATVPAGYYAGFRISTTNVLNALSSIKLKTYLSGSLQETASGLGLLSLITGGEGDVYFKTLLPHDAIRIEFAGLLSVGVDAKIFYGFSQAANPVTVLPLNFKTVQVIANKAYNNISWSVEGNESIDHFEIERSSNAQNFISVGNVPAQASGNFQYRDYTSLNKVYYRVKAYTKTGTHYISTIVLAAASTTCSVTVLNPAHGQIILNTSTPIQEPLTIIVVSEEGKLVFQERKVIGSNYVINLPGGATKTYLVTIYKDQQQILSTRVLNLN